MTAEDVVTGALAGIGLGETVIAPGIADYGLLQRVFDADLDVFTNQSPDLAARYEQS